MIVQVYDRELSFGIHETKLTNCDERPFLEVLVLDCLFLKPMHSEHEDEVPMVRDRDNT
jgi:hypothetical protein